MTLHGQTFDLENPTNTFFHGDCVEGMKAFPDDYFDLAVVDPPYSNPSTNSSTDIHFQGGGWSRKYYDKEKDFETGKTKLSVPKWDSAPTEEYFNELFRVSKNQVIWGGNYFSLPPTRCFLIWRKLSISENFTMAMAEYAWTSFDENAKVYECIPQDPTKTRWHPTAKPVKLYEWILSRYAKEGDLILDSHVGSGSSLIACRNTNHKYVGFEINEEYYRKAKQRVDAEVAQINLFDLMEEQTSTFDLINGSNEHLSNSKGY